MCLFQSHLFWRSNSISNAFFFVSSCWLVPSRSSRGEWWECLICWEHSHGPLRPVAKPASRIMILIFVEANLRNCEESGHIFPSLTKVTFILDNYQFWTGFFQRLRPEKPISLFDSLSIPNKASVDREKRCTYLKITRRNSTFLLHTGLFY